MESDEKDKWKKMIRMKYNIIISVIIGTISGFILGIFLWITEEITGEKVYTLLLNVDFLFQDKELAIWIEWVFHLVISWIIVYFYVIIRPSFNTRAKQFMLIMSVSLIAAGSYIPLTILAIRETPAVTNGEAVGFWLVGHILYGISVYYGSNNRLVGK